MRGLAALDRFVPAAIRARGPDALRRTRLALGASLLGALTFLWGSVEQWVRGRPDVALLTGSALLLLAALPLLIRWTGSLALVAHGIPFLLLAFCLGFAAATGGRATGALVGAVTVPLSAVLLGGFRSGLVWCALTCVGLVGVGAAGGAASSFPLDAPAISDRWAPIRSAMLVCLGVTGVGAIYESLHQRALRDLASAHSRAAAAARRRLESERRFRTLTENASDVITEWDSTGFISYISPQIESFTGSAPEHFVETHWVEHVDRIHRDDVDAFRRALERVVGGDGSSEAAFRFRHEDGSWRWFELVFRPFRTAAGEVRVVSVGRDVTDRREVETLRRLTGELEDTASALARANRDLEELAAVASRDLLEPLRSLRESSERLHEALGAGLPPAAARELDSIRNGAERTSRLARDWVALSRAGTAPMKPESLLADACLDRALERLAPRILESGAAVQRAPLPELRADPDLLTQVFQHLIANALAFSGGRPPQVRVTAERLRGRWTLGVHDVGIGVDPADAEEVFQPFVRLDSGAAGGSGIGLALCRKAVERHGGRIWMESKPGRWTHVRFTLEG